MQNTETVVDTSKWSGEGEFTQFLLDHLRTIPEIAVVRVEDAPASRSEADYNFMLRHLLLLPMDSRDVAHLGEVELARYRAMEALLTDPSLADPDPKRVANIPPDQQAFLAAYQSREQEMIQFLKDKRLITIPDYVGPFLIRQLPEAFKPTSPGGFMNPPANVGRRGRHVDELRLPETRDQCR